MTNTTRVDARLGELAPEESVRDAIHVAILPVIAGHILRPGEHVAVVDGVAWSTKTETHGIVDPFLKSFVLEGERFYLCLYPGSITSLTHHWSHPSL